MVPSSPGSLRACGAGGGLAFADSRCPIAAAPWCVRGASVMVEGAHVRLSEREREAVRATEIAQKETRPRDERVSDRERGSVLCVCVCACVCE